MIFGDLVPHPGKIGEIAAGEPVGESFIVLLAPNHALTAVPTLSFLKDGFRYDQSQLEAKQQTYCSGLGEILFLKFHDSQKQVRSPMPSVRSPKE